jgi:hypothetical protein
MSDESSNGVYAEWACELTLLYHAKPNSSVVRSPNRRRKISEVSLMMHIRGKRDLWN